MHHVLNDSTTDFIHSLALKAKHWLPRTGHTRPKVKNSNCSVQYVSQSHSQHPATPTYLELISNVFLKMTILTTIFVTSCTFYQILGSYMVLVEVTRDSHVLRNAAATKPSWVAVDLILKSEDRAQVFSRKVMLLFLTRDNEVAHKVNHAWNSYIIPRHHPTSSNWIITWNTVLLKKPLAATVGPNISSCLKTPNFN